MTFKTIEDDITIILKNSKAARCDDMVLYAAYVSNKLSENTFLQSMLYRVFTDPEFRISRGIATYGSVSRVRRKLQEEYPELKAPRAVIEQKKELEKNYRAYARKGVKK